MAVEKSGDGGASSSSTSAASSMDRFHKIILSWDYLRLVADSKFEEGVTPTAYSFALVEQRGGRETISLRTFLAGEIKNLNVAKPVSSSRLQRIASIFANHGELSMDFEGQGACCTSQESPKNMGKKQLLAKALVSSDPSQVYTRTSGSDLRDIIPGHWKDYG